MQTDRVSFLSTGITPNDGINFLPILVLVGQLKNI